MPAAIAAWLLAHQALAAWLLAHQALAAALATYLGLAAAGIDVAEKVVDLEHRIEASTPAEEPAK